MDQTHPPTPTDAVAIVNNPNAAWDELITVARFYPYLHPIIAGHPNASPALLHWLSESSDPAVQQALDDRIARATKAASRTPSAARRTPLPALIGVGLASIAALVGLTLLTLPASSWPGITLGSSTASSHPTELSYPSTSPATPASTSGLPKCPTKTIRLAYATFSDGWVVVCGANAKTPSYWISTDNSSKLESYSLTYNSRYQRYTAEFTDGTYAWLNHTPGVYGRTGDGGNIQTQRSVGVVWFVAEPSSGQQTSTSSAGPYGVPAPQDTAADQVRYLADLLSSSANARAELQPAVTAVRNCTHSSGDYSGEIATISGVVDNRRQLLQALASAPVDRVPDGTALVSELRIGLGYSLKADDAYLAWANAVNTNGCGAGSQAVGNSNSEKAGTAKAMFVEHWNLKIAGNFAVTEISRTQL